MGLDGEESRICTAVICANVSSPATRRLKIDALDHDTDTSGKFHTATHSSIFSSHSHGPPGGIGVGDSQLQVDSFNAQET